MVGTSDIPHKLGSHHRFLSREHTLYTFTLRAVALALVWERGRKGWEWKSLLQETKLKMMEGWANPSHATDEQWSEIKNGGGSWLSWLEHEF